MTHKAKLQVSPNKGAITRATVYANSREGESLNEFIGRMSKNKSVINGKRLVVAGDYEQVFIPRYGEERWVVKLMEEHYA